MENRFFSTSCDQRSIALRIEQLENGKVGFFSVGLYPASLAYNCAMQTNGDNLLLAPRPGRDLFGAFDSTSLKEMKTEYIERVNKMAFNNKHSGYNSLADLLLNCELVILSSNSNYIEKDLKEACRLRKELNRQNVVLGCLVGSFCHSRDKNRSYVLCQKEPNLAFFSGFHRHGSLRNESDSFTANFCHPDALTALLGTRLLNKISPNIQVTAGVHNIEAQYIKATKNISSIFAGFAHHFHRDNTGILPTLLTLLLEQCLSQAATVSMQRPDRKKLYSEQLIPITELGYGVQRIEAALVSDGDFHQVRDHTFSQLTAIVADLKGSMMQPQIGNPTRNFQVGSVFSEKILFYKRCPDSLEELIQWCEESGLKRGGLEGLNSLKYWPEIMKMYSIPLQDSSMINLIYVSIFGSPQAKTIAYKILTNSRELTSYCITSVKHPNGATFGKLLSRVSDKKFLEYLAKFIKTKNNKFLLTQEIDTYKENIDSTSSSVILKIIKEILG